MVEEVRSIKVTIEVETNKRSKNWVIEGVSFAELYKPVDEIFDEIEGMNG